VTDALGDFLSVVVNGAVTAAMVLLVVAFLVCAIGPFFFGRNDR
jgi:hypothetical protein